MIYKDKNLDLTKPVFLTYSSTMEDGFRIKHNDDTSDTLNVAIHKIDPDDESNVQRVLSINYTEMYIADLRMSFQPAPYLNANGEIDLSAQDIEDIISNTVIPAVIDKALVEVGDPGYNFKLSDPNTLTEILEGTIETYGNVIWINIEASIYNDVDGNFLSLCGGELNIIN